MRALVLLLGFSAPWLTWTVIHSDFRFAAVNYIHASIWVPLKDALSAGLTVSGWQNPNTYCYKETNSVVVFFHVTNATEEWLPIEVCAFKLAAIHNNDTGVCVLTAYPMEPHPKLAQIKNLEIAPLKYDLLFNDTPLSDWYEKFMLKNKRSQIWMWELSDALRYTYLYKYGGKYMDTDSWTLRNLAPLQNVAGWQDGGLIANGVLFFERKHPFIDAIMQNFSKYFSSGSWGSSGPFLVSRIHRSGQVDNTTYTLVAPHVFYPTHYSQNHYPFVASHKEAVKNMIKGSYALHLWRYMIRKYWNASNPPPEGSYVEEMLSTVC